MAEYVIGGLVRSLAGHDKGSLFIIIRQDAEYAYLADGKLRCLDKLKRKKKKHLQIIGVKDDNLHRKLKCSDPVTDEEIKYFIKCYIEKTREAN